jgi:chemotaxis protein methyltransferase CheR
MAAFCDLIYRATGIRIPPQKKTLMSNRIRRRLRQLDLESFDGYFRLLQRLKADDEEWDAFLQEITTHETYLFRDELQWDWFQNEYLPAIAAQASAGQRPRTLRIWSAACSTGDEPCTIACCVAGCLPNLTQWKIQILGTDIGVGALAEAQAQTFNQRAMRLVPEKYQRAFFTKAAQANSWQAKPILTNMLKFRQHNLLQPLGEPRFDVVFLKNVLIYFDAESKKQVLSQLRSSIQPGGLLVAGAAEGVFEYLKGFDRLQPWLFRWPKGGGDTA